MPTPEQARRIARDNAEHNPEFVRALWFPDDREYRLVYVDPTSVPSEGHLGVFEFRHEERDGIQIPMLVAVVRPEEVEEIPLPEDWGDWDDAEVVYEAA